MMWLKIGLSFFGNKMSVPLLWQMVVVRTVVSSLRGAGSNNGVLSLAPSQHWLHVTPQPPVAVGKHKDKARPCRRRRATALTHTHTHTLQNSRSITFPDSIFLIFFITSASFFWPHKTCLCIPSRCRLPSGLIIVGLLVNWGELPQSRSKEAELSCRVTCKAGVKQGK